jgi:hypothetical protein
VAYNADDSTTTMTSLCLLEDVPKCSQYIDRKELRRALRDG